MLRPKISALGLFLLLLCPFLSGGAEATPYCRAHLIPAQSVGDGEWSVVEVNGAVARSYPLPYISNNLGLSEIGFETRNRILLVGEGFSPLLSHLLNQGAQVRALDLWYDYGEFPSNPMGLRMQRFARQYAPYLDAGSALQMPYPMGRFDWVFSHMLLNNLGYEERLVVLREILRVLAPGGQARLAFFGGSTTRSLIDFVAAEGGASVQVRGGTLTPTPLLDFRQTEDLAPDLHAVPAAYKRVDYIWIQKAEN